MFKIKHFLSNAFASLFRSTVGYRPFGGECKVVETSRYTHASDTEGNRVYMSKPSWTGGLVLSTHAVSKGDEYISITLSEGSRVVFSTTCLVVDAKAIAATLASACMKAQPKTGREMAASTWQPMEDAVQSRKAAAEYEASLFDTV